MTSAKIADLSHDHAQYLIETVASVARATFEQDTSGDARSVLQMPAEGLRLLESLPEDADGHLDEYEQVWIGGDVAGRIVGFIG